MLPAPIERTYELLSDIAACATGDAVTALVLEWSSPYGVEHLLAGVIPPMNAAPVTQAKHVLLGRWPAEWGRAYFHHGLLARDPTIRRVLRRVPPFSWASLSSDGAENLRIMDEAREHGLAAGITVPMVTLEGRAAGFSYAGGYVDDSPEAIGCLSLVAALAVGRVLELRRGENVESVRLTKREAEVLAWTADGKTDWEISVILGVSEQAVRKHAVNTRQKLGAVNRVHAVAEAMRRNLIR